MKCPCQSGQAYADCCEPYISGKVNAPTAEALMRARYTAHEKGAISYIKKTLAPEMRSQFDEAAVKEWSEKSEWLGLQVISTKKGGAGDKIGTVEFNARYQLGGKVREHHEVSQFRKEGDQWYFVDGDSHVHEDGKGHHHHHEKQEPIVRGAPKVGRNDPCPCGSGKKFKKCCEASA